MLVYSYMRCIDVIMKIVRSGFQFVDRQVQLSSECIRKLFKKEVRTSCLMHECLGSCTCTSSVFPFCLYVESAVQLGETIIDLL